MTVDVRVIGAHGAERDLDLRDEEIATPCGRHHHCRQHEPFSVATDGDVVADGWDGTLVCTPLLGAADESICVVPWPFTVGVTSGTFACSSMRDAGAAAVATGEFSECSLVIRFMV